MSKTFWWFLASWFLRWSLCFIKISLWKSCRAFSLRKFYEIIFTAYSSISLIFLVAISFKCLSVLLLRLFRVSLCWFDLWSVVIFLYHYLNLKSISLLFIFNFFFSFLIKFWFCSHFDCRITLSTYLFLSNSFYYLIN